MTRPASRDRRAQCQVVGFLMPFTRVAHSHRESRPRLVMLETAVRFRQRRAAPVSLPADGGFLLPVDKPLVTNDTVGMMRPDGLTTTEPAWDELTPWEQAELLRMGYRLPVGTVVHDNADLESK